MICDRCGATIEESAFCKYCGARVLRPPTDARAAATDPGRFAAAHASVGYRQADGYVPRSPPVAINLIAPVVMLLFVFGFIAAAASMMGHGEPAAFRMMFFAVPALMIGVCVYLFVRGIRFARAPVARWIGVVTDERTEVSSRGKDGSVSTRYFATLQRQDGSRVEFDTYGWLAGRIAAGDIGVAFVKGTTLIDFLRLEA